jgi:geranylgeranyl reductase family protein
MSCDILVVGAGPAGGAAALAAVRKGMRVLVAEKRRSVGVPVQCAEFIPAMMLGSINTGRSFIAQSVRYMKTHISGVPVKETRAPGFIIHRNLFDQALIQAAIESGAELIVSTRAVQLTDNQTILLKQKSGQHISVNAQIIIGADGPRSTVGRWVGTVNRNMLPGIQVTLPLVEPMDWTEIYLDPEFYAGYGWLFPKNNVANIGVGMKKSNSNPKKIRSALDRIIARLVAEGKVTGRPIRCTAGWIPLEPVRQAVHGNVVLVGDAAGHTHPISGAGIYNAVICGEMAGRWAAKAVQKGNVNLLKHYDEQWQDLLQDTFDRARQRRRTMESGWQNFSSIIRSCWIAFREYYG